MLVVAALFFSPLFLMKAAATPSASATVGFVHPGEGGSPGYSGGGDYSASASGSDPQFSDSYFGYGLAELTSNGSSDLPDLHAEIIAEPGNPESVQATATLSESKLSFSTNALFTSNSYTPSTFNFTFNFNVSGTLTGDATASLELDFGSYSNTLALASGANPYSLTVSGSYLTITQQNNQAFLQGAYSEILTVDGNNIDGNGGTTGTSMGDFQDTVQLTSVDVTDADGNPVPGTFSDGDQVSFASNTPLTPTPEPSTTALLASSVLLLAFLAKKRLRAT